MPAPSAAASMFRDPDIAGTTRAASEAAGVQPGLQSRLQPARPLPWFTRFAQGAAHVAGQPATFMAAVALIVIWAVSGPIFGYSDAWQLVINTSTTIVTFLMVFLIQNSQNRDSMEIQLKLTELVLAVHGARNQLATIEDLSDQELESLHQDSRRRAEAACLALEQRRRDATAQRGMQQAAQAQETQ